MKSHSLEHILGLPEEQIAELYPHGATLQPDKRWIAAEMDLHGMGHRTLGDLIADKRRRIVKPRYMAQGSPRNHLRWDKQARRWVEIGWQADEEHGYTPNPARALDPGAEPIPKADEERYSTEARERFVAERPDEVFDQQAKVFWNKLCKVQREGMKHGVDLAPRLRAILKEAQDEIVDKRKEAA